MSAGSVSPGTKIRTNEFILPVPVEKSGEERKFVPFYFGFRRPFMLLLAQPSPAGFAAFAESFHG